jgi:hypothetical protein
MRSMSIQHTMNPFSIHHIHLVADQQLEFLVLKGLCMHSEAGVGGNAHYGLPIHRLG